MFMMFKSKNTNFYKQYFPNWKTCVEIIDAFSNSLHRNLKIYQNFKTTPIKLEMHFYETYDIPLDNFEKFWFQVPP